MATSRSDVIQRERVPGSCMVELNMYEYYLNISFYVKADMAVASTCKLSWIGLSHMFEHCNVKVAF